KMSDDEKEPKEDQVEEPEEAEEDDDLDPSIPFPTGPDESVPPPDHN
ncbi:MAG: hypothetical protein GY719_27875, partial [bacterium]|nr:hypothetical protein [bacterium]